MSKTEEIPRLYVVARAPFNLYYEGEADVLTASNRVGEFDVLPGHADFFSILEPCEVNIAVSEKIEPISFNISNGILTVRDNEVLLFVNI